VDDVREREGDYPMTEQQQSQAATTTTATATNNTLDYGTLKHGGSVAGDLVFQLAKGDHWAHLIWEPGFSGTQTRVARIVTGTSGSGEDEGGVGNYSTLQFEGGAVRWLMC
jgi:hypothetical protein